MTTSISNHVELEATTLRIDNKSLCEDTLPHVNPSVSSGSSPGNETLTSDSTQPPTDHTSATQIAPNAEKTKSNLSLHGANKPASKPDFLVELKELRQLHPQDRLTTVYSKQRDRGCGEPAGCVRGRESSPSESAKDTRFERIREGVSAFLNPGQVIELRIPKAGRFRTVSGYFDDPQKLAQAIDKWSGKEGVEGVYYTLNPVEPALLARSANRAKVYAQITTADKDVLKRTKLLVDIDPTRPSGVSSTNAEKKLAGQKARAVRDFLRERGWPEPLAADSGNGYHLLYGIDLPNDEQSTNLVKSCLEALAAKFNDEAVKVDTSVFNAARIVKAYGSLAAKGDSTAERPHRVACLLKTKLPGGRENVSRDKLEALAAEVSKAESKQPNVQTCGQVGPAKVGPATPTEQGQVVPAKVEEFLNYYGVEHCSSKPYAGGTTWILKQCPFDSSHNGTSVAVVLRRDGVLGFECKHDSCQPHTWKEFRKKLEDLNGGRKFQFFDHARDVLHSPVQVEIIEPLQTQEMDAVPAYPSECIDGDYIADLTHALADGTAIPPQFIRENAKTILGALTDGRVGFVGEEDMHSRQYNMNVSTDPGAGKGVSWRRTGQNNTGVLNRLLFDTATDQTLVEIIDGTRFGSGEYMVKVLKEHPICLARFDEISELYAKDHAQGSTLDQKFLTLFDSNSASTGSFKNKEYVAENIHLSVSGDTTHSAFTSAFAGRGSGGNGLLSRFVFAYGDKLPVEGDWPTIDGIAVTKALTKIRASLEFLKTDLCNSCGRFVPREAPEAAALRYEFFAWLQAQDRRYTGRLEAHMKRDLIARALFSHDNKITSTMMDRGIAWARHQLEIRQVLWPEDAGNPVERMERKILDVLHKRLDKILQDNPDLDTHKATVAAGLSDRDLTKLCNVDREGSGGRETYRRAINALSLGSREIERVGKNRKGSAIWGLVKS